MSKIMWEPSDAKIKASQMMAFISFVNDKFNLSFKSYEDIYNWSIEESENFWECFLQFSNISYQGNFVKVVDDINKMPGAKWFSGINLNFAENLLNHRDEKIAIHFYGENQKQTLISYSELYKLVAQLASSMRKMGVKKNDRVVGFLPNIPETIIAMLATTSLGAIWSSCSPDFGIKGILDRFNQISPKLIFTTSGYLYNGKQISCVEKNEKIISKLSTLEKNVIIPCEDKKNNVLLNNSIFWDDFLSNDDEIKFELVPFDHPLYIMYSSGTTGLPKSIVHSVGGTLLQHIKELKLHVDLKKEDTIFYFTTCGWMMWNWLVSSLFMGSTIILYDGNPFYPDEKNLLKMAKKLKINVFGTSAKYISALQSKKIFPSEISTFPYLRCILSTGSPLVDENYDFIYNNWKKDVQLSSISGGTDIISCFALGNPILPVKRGELQCRGLGMKVESFDDNGNFIYDTKGELVCTKAFPSMPIYFWNDNNNNKFKKAYFSVFSNIWYHGDYISISKSGGLKIFGRSDTTLNPGGVRIGTSEIYQAVEYFKEIEDSLVIGQPWKNDERIILFVKLKNNDLLSNQLKEKIKLSIKKTCSPRHVPEKIIQINDIPYTINGKKVELAVKQVIQNIEVKNKDVLANPDVLDAFKEIVELRV
ncbi:MAG: acetoacetate--CoA ligase [Acidimicrobiaceae bacterium]|nr:acetoacetate--CoA ligase [Acidimicrobiaceae bacterium]